MSIHQKYFSTPEQSYHFCMWFFECVGGILASVYSNPVTANMPWDIAVDNIAKDIPLEPFFFDQLIGIAQMLKNIPSCSIDSILGDHVFCIVFIPQIKCFEINDNQCFPYTYLCIFVFPNFFFIIAKSQNQKNTKTFCFYY